jgi:nitroreductase
MTDRPANDAGPNGDVVRLLRSHRSIRRFTAEPIPPELLETLIQAGQGAASSSFVQAYSVVRVTRPQVRAAIARAAGNQPWIEQAPEFLVFCADLCRVEAACLANGAGVLEGWSEHGLTAVVDCTLMAQGVMVAAESVGLGGVFIGGIRNDPQVVVDQLGLPRQVLPVFAMCLGWPDESPEVKPRQPLSMVLHQDRYREPTQEAIADYDRTMSDYYERRGNNARRSDWSATTARAVQGKRREHMLAFMRRMGYFEK